MVYPSPVMGILWRNTTKQSGICVAHPFQLNIRSRCPLDWGVPWGQHPQERVTRSGSKTSGRACCVNNVWYNVCSPNGRWFINQPTSVYNRTWTEVCIFSGDGTVEDETLTKHLHRRRFKICFRSHLWRFRIIIMFVDHEYKYRQD